MDVGVVGVLLDVGDDIEECTPDQLLRTNCVELFVRLVATDISSTEKDMGGDERIDQSKRILRRNNLIIFSQMILNKSLYEKILNEQRQKKKTHTYNQSNSDEPIINNLFQQNNALYDSDNY